MKQMKLLAASAALLACAVASGDTWTNGNYVWSYTMNNGLATLTGVAMADGSEVTGDLVLPSAVGEGAMSSGYTVVAIGDNSFNNLNITSLKIADTIGSIGRFVFRDCGMLERLDMGSGVMTISGGNGREGRGSFSNCTNLKSIVFSPQLGSIGDNSFSCCHALESLDFPNSLVSIGGWCFSEIWSVTNITFSLSLEEIDGYSFTQSRSLKSLEFPDSLKRIKTGKTWTYDGYTSSFYDAAALETIHFGKRLEYIGKKAFMDCPKLRTVTFAESEAPSLEIEDRAFMNCAKLESLAFPDSLVSIFGRVCENCTSLESVTFGSSLRTIKGAFNGCSSLKALTFPDTLQTIWYGSYGSGNDSSRSSTFDGCTSLETIVMGDRVSSLTGFNNCSSLTNIVFSQSLQTLGDATYFSAFQNCTMLREVELPSTLQSIGRVCFKGSGLRSISFPAKLGSIGTGSFCDCPNLESVTFTPADTPILTIQAQVFQNNPKLDTITFSESLASIGDGFLYNCAALKSLAFPDSLKTIGGGYYGSCSKCISLESVSIGNGVTNIGQCAFEKCTSLKSVKFGNSLVSINYAAFNDCTSLETLDFPDSVQSIASCFRGCKSLSSVRFGKGIRYIGPSAFGGCIALQYVSFAPFGTSPLSISSLAFENDVSLKSVILPGSLQSLDANVFKGCSSLTTLTIPQNVGTLGANVFSSMGGVTDVTFTGYPPEGLAASGLTADTRIRYSSEMADEWEAVIEECGFKKAVPYNPPEDPGSGGSWSETGSLALTVTNVVIHYVTQSVPSAAVVPAATDGIVNIISEVNAGSAVAITEEWSHQYPGFDNIFGQDFAKALTAQTGKVDGAGKPMMVWQDFVAGTDPTNPNDKFTASITFDKDTNEPVISWSPELSPTEASKRSYKKYGKVRLNDSEWTEIGDGDASAYNFFKVAVEMK